MWKAEREKKKSFAYLIPSLAGSQNSPTPSTRRDKDSKTETESL